MHALTTESTAAPDHRAAWRRAWALARRARAKGRAGPEGAAMACLCAREQGDRLEIVATGWRLPDHRRPAPAAGLGPH